MEVGSKLREESAAAPGSEGQRQATATVKCKAVQPTVVRTHLGLGDSSLKDHFLVFGTSLHLKLVNIMKITALPDQLQLARPPLPHSCPSWVVRPRGPGPHSVDRDMKERPSPHQKPRGQW